jgi:hypothetical protein
MLISIYLNDHLAAATGLLELARRAAGENRGSDHGELLARLELEVAEDRSALREIMSALGVAPDPLKMIGGWVAEKAGRLKLNGRLRSYSPLSRLVELEVLSLGVRGKLALWRSLEQLAATEERLDADDLRRLIRRAERQLRALERHRLDAAAEALTAD